MFVGKKGKPPMNSKRAANKLKFKNKKFGFGGKKKGLKRNTKDSAADISEYGAPKGGFKNKGKNANMRPGKSKRQKSKARGGK